MHVRYDKINTVVSGNMICIVIIIITAVCNGW